MREIDELTLPENNRASVSPVSVEAAVDAVIQGRDRRQARVLFNLDDARKTNPDQENIIRKDAAAVGMPVDAARAFPDDAARRANALRLQKMRLAQDFPHTMAFFEDINNARIAHDDIDNLKETESVFTNISDLGRSFGAGIVSDFLGNIAQGAEENILRSQYGAMSELQAMTGGDELSQSGIADEQGREAVMGTSRFIKKDIGEYIDIPKERRNRLRNKIAREFGQVAGQIVITAATGGYGGMFFLGMQGSGQMSESLAEDRKRLLEKGINPSIAGEQAAFLGGSAVTALTEKFGLDFMTGKYTPALIRLAEKYGAPAIVKMIENRGVRFATGALLAGADEGTQEVTEDLGQTWLRTALVDRSVQVPDAEQLWDEFLVGGLVGMITHGAVNARSILKSRENKRVVEAATDTAARSKLNERDSEAYGKYFKGVAEDSKADGAFIRKDAWDAYYQSENMDPARAAERYGITNYSDAAESGAYLEMPLERHGSDFAKTDAAIKLKDHTKYFSDPEVVTPYELALLEADQARIDRELQKTLADINATHGKRQNLEDAIDAITEDVSAQLQARWGESTSNTQATLMARWFSVSRMRDELSRDPEATDEKIIRRIADEWQKKGLNIRANVLPAILTKRKSVDISIDPMLGKLRRNEWPKERDVYGQSLMEYIRKKGGIRPDDITRDLVKNKQLPRSILNEKGMGADELAALQDVLDFGLDTETTQGDNALLDALVAEYTTGEKRYSNAQLDSGLLSEAQALNELASDLKAAGIDLSTNTDNAAVREALSKYYEEQNGENTRKEPETAETGRYEQRGFTESDTPTTEERAEANRQYDEIEKKYRGTPLWMKAPNGEPTKLTERQWVQVRTPNFKRWFGDWEKAGIRERLEGQEPIPVKSKFTEETARIKKSEAAALLKEPFSVKKNIGEVFVTRNGIRDSIAHSRYPAKLDVIPHLREILEQAEYLDTLNDFDGKDIQNHYFVARINHDGRTKLVFLRVRERANTRQLYVHDVFLEDEIKKADSLQTSPRGRTTTATRGTSLYKSILQDIYATDNESVSKVVDSNGEPMVVYHGTKSDFDTFRPSGSRKTEGTGMWFGTAENAGTYSGGEWDKGSIMPVFLNAKNPLIVEARNHFWNELGADVSVKKHGQKRGTTLAKLFPEAIRNRWSDFLTSDDMARYAGEEGYDGAVFNNMKDSGPTNPTGKPSTVYSVREPNQIKSAIGNTGTFTDNPNILYQFIGEKGAAALDRANEATIRLDNLSIAREMETAGKDSKVIKFATGWERGADGKWRHEIDDSHSAFGVNGDIEFQKRHPEYQRMKELSEKFLLGELSSEELGELKNSESIWGREPERLRERLEDGKATLPDVLDHPELFHAYPKLKDMQVAVRSIGDGFLGFYLPDEKRIVLDRGAPDKARTLLHEVQHAIQDIEGFAKGGTPSRFKDEFIWTIRAPRERAAVELGILWDKLTETPEYRKAGEIWEAMILAKTDEEWRALVDENPGFDFEDPAKLYEKTEAYRKYREAEEQYEKDFGDDWRAWLDARRSSDEMEKYTFEQYRRLAGETEARNVSKRLAMTPEERRASLAEETEDVVREDQIFLYQSFEGKNAPVVRLTGDELGDSADIFDAARNWYKQNLQGTSVNRSEIGDIRFSGKGWNKVKRGIKGDSLKARIIPAIRDVIAHGEYHGRTGLNKSRTDDIVAFHYFTADVSIGDEIIPVGVNVGEDVYGNLFYNINHHPDDLLKKKAPILPGEEARGLEPDKKPRNHQSSSHGPRVQDTASDVLEQSIGQNGDGVNLFILNEKKQGKVRGATIIHPDRTMRIELFADADFSTFAHETAHFMLEDFADMARSENASQYAKDEFARICKYLGADPDEKFTREQHEKFAQSFEKYLMEGKAPSLELKDIFRKFRTWLQDIYRVLKLHVTLSKDIRDVFDRMLATDREIEVARSVNRYADTMFATAEDMGVSREVFETYKKLNSDSIKDAQEKMLGRIMRFVRRKKTKEYKEELEAVKEQVRKAYQEEPASIAIQTLGDPDSEVRLDKNDLVGRYGKAYLGKLPRNGKNRLYTDEGGVDADTAAELLGYPSGDAMLEAITTLPSETEYVDAEAERIMRERYGDLLNSDYLPDLAQEVLHNEARQDMLAHELRALRKLQKAGEAAVKGKERTEKESFGMIKKRISLAREAARQFAQRTIDEKSVGQIRPYSYLQAARKASREAFDFVAKKQYDKAAEAKYRELISTALYSEAVKARSGIDSDRKLFSRILSGSEKKLAKTRSMNPVYRARYILARHGIGNRADDWLEKLQTAGKYENVDATAEPSKDWREMSFSEFAAMADEVKGLWELSRRDKVVEIDGKRLEVAAVAENIRDEIEKFGVADEEHVEKTGISQLLDDWSTSMKRVEQQFDMIGGEDGVLMTKVFQPMKDAAVRARLKQTEVMDRMQAVISKLKFKPGKISAPELIDKETGRPHVFGRGEICGAAEVFGALLHTGNESNYRKLLLGRGWATADAEGRMNTSSWDAFIERMVREGYITKAHYDAAQAIWDEFEALKPLTQKANKAIYGTWFKEIGIDGIVTPFGQYKGGYVPAKTDKNVVPDAQLNELKDVDAGKVQSMMPISQPGFTKSRSETYAEALDMNPRTIIGATNRIISFAYIAPVYNDVRKILQHDSVKNAMHRYNPRFLRDVISPWMNRARQQTATTDLNDPGARRWATLRSRAGAMFMFNNVKNVVQSSADFLVAASEVKPGNLMAAVLNHDGKAIAEKSEYMRDRFGKSQIAMMDNIDSILIDAGTLKKADRWLMQHAYWMQQLADDRMSTITWTAAYNDAIQDGKSELQAIRHADRIVRKVFASQNAEDVSNIEAGTAFKRLFTQFSGFFIVRSNLVATELGKIARESGAKGSDSATTKALKILSNKKMKAAILLLAKIVVPAIVDTELALLLKGLMPGDDDWMREMFIGSAGYVSGLGGPYANLLGESVINVANVATGGRISSYDSRLASAPAISILEDVLKQSALIAKGGITPERIMKFGTDLTVMPVAPVVPMQVTRQATYLSGVARGKIKPTGTVDFVRGMATGTASPDSR